MGKLPAFYKRSSYLLIIGLAGKSLASAQAVSLNLSVSAVAAGATASLNLSLSGSAGPASLEWTLTYPASSVSALSVTPGAALTVAGKSLICLPGSGTYQCLASGVNTTAISDGVVATVSITPAITLGTVSMSLVNAVAASSTGGSLTTSATGGTLTVGSMPVLSSFACSPSSITTPGTSSCTATLSGAAPSGGVTLTIGGANSTLTVPASLVIAAGSASGAFTASASGVTASTSDTVTASLGTASLNATLTLVPPAPSAPSLVTNSLACLPSSLAPAGSTTCTIILSGIASTGGAAVTLTASSSSLTVPASVTVPAGSSSTTFSATAAAVTAVQLSVITAAVGGSSLTDTVVLNPAAGPTTLSVGPGQRYLAPCSALTTAADGSTITIDAAGTYSGDVCTVTANNLTIRGIHGRPLINAAGLNSAGAAWLFQGNNITLDTIELTGAAGSTNNAAAVLMSGANLVVLNSYIHDNQEGLVTAASAHSQILIQATEFNHNGFGDGLTHNVDVNSAARFTMQYCYSHSANGGDLVKTQASENYILFNRLTSEQGTTSSELDLNHGGRSFVIGNLIEKGSSDTGTDAVGYLLGGASASNPSSELYVVSNTLVSDKGTSVNFLNIGSADSTPAIVTNNIFYGAGVASTQPTSVVTASLTANPLFVNQAAYDYHLTSGSPAVNAGAAAGSADGLSLVPAYQYLDPSCGQARTLVAAVDIGAYEFGGAGAALYCAVAASAISLSPGTVTGGTVTTSNTVTLSVPAPSSGTVVTLTSSKPTAAAVPATVTVPSGALTAAFNITTSAVTASTGVTISAAYSGTSQSATLMVMPPATSSALASFTCSPTSLRSYSSSSCVITLKSAAPAGGSTIAVSSGSNLIALPQTVTVAAGATSVTFTAKTGKVPNSRIITVTATVGGTSLSVKFSLSR
jgi:hypothetical protein